MFNHDFYMGKALKEAQKAFLKEEVPIGAIIVQENKIISRAFNLKEKRQDATCHAEILAIQKASKKLGSWRLNKCSLYVTIEPCSMCAGAIIQSRISLLAYGSPNPIYGSFNSVIETHKLFPDARSLEIISGIKSEEASLLMKSFFRKSKG